MLQEGGTSTWFGISRFPNLIPFDFAVSFGWVAGSVRPSRLTLNIFRWLSGSTGLAETACFDLLFSALAIPFSVLVVRHASVWHRGKCRHG